MASRTHRPVEGHDVADLEPIFAAERDERLASMEQGLLALERADSQRARAAALEVLRRDAHSLKGAAQLLDKRQIADITHALETRLEMMQARAPTQADLDLLLRAVDALRLLSRGGADRDFEDTLADLRRGVARPLEQIDLHLPRDPEARRPAEETSPRATEETSPRATEETSPHPTAPDSAEPVIRVATRRLDVLLNRSAEFSDIRQASERQRATVHSISADILALRRELASIRARARATPAGAGRMDEAFDHLLRDVEQMEQRSIELSRATRQAARSATSHAQEVARVAADLEAELLDLRMVPVETLLRGFPRMVRDLARDVGRQVSLEAVGWQTPIDHAVAARLKDPIMHLLRNAVVHGIEPPDVREKAGKPRAGHISLSAGQRGRDIVLEIRDDGAGIDAEAVHRRALAEGRIGEGTPVSTDLALDLILEPQFSTTEQADSRSGRGVGLDVVRSQMSELGGTVEIHTERGHGTTFMLRLPLTLVSQHVVVARIGERRYGLPFDAVERIVAMAPESTTNVGGGTVLRDAEETLTLVDGGRLLDVPREQPGNVRSGLAVIIGARAGHVAVSVDGLDGERELVVKDLGSLVRGLPLYAGAAVIEDDSLLLVLDPSELVQRALSLAMSGQGLPEPPAGDRVPRILVVDDSITTRTLEKNVLAAAGFDVLTAVDGSDALRVLRTEQVDLVLSDVEMPRLDGLKMSKRIRNDARLRDTPILLVSGVQRDDLREAALAAGANGFLAKSALDQRELLRIIQELIG